MTDEGRPTDGAPPGGSRPLGLADASAALLEAEVARASQDPSRQIGRYVILSSLGRGGVGEVFRAWDPALRRLVALKMLLPEAAARPTTVARFHREALAVARLRHPNIVGIHEVGDVDGRLFFAMDLVPGGTLETWLGANPTRDEVIALLAEVARALGYAHGNGIVHRDVKPRNILVDAESRPLLVDFGLARDESSDDARLTRQGEIVGTAAYMAPEQISSSLGAVGPATDVWAMGVVLYEALTGRAPFFGASSVETMASIAGHDPAPVNEVDPTISPAVADVVTRCLEKDPAERFPSGNALAAALDAASGTTAPAGSGPAAAPAARRASARLKRPSARQKRPSARRAAADVPDAGRTEARPPPAPAATIAGVPASLAGPAIAVVFLAVAVVFFLLGASGGQPEPGPGPAVGLPSPGTPGPTVEPTVAVAVSLEQERIVTNAEEVAVAGRVTAGHAQTLIVGKTIVRVADDGTFTETIALTEGPHRLDVRPGPDDEPIAAIEVVIDRTPPAVEVDRASIGAVAARETAVVGKVEDATEVTLTLGDAAAVVAAPGGPFELPVSIPANADRVELELLAADAAGNTVSARLILGLDVAPPELVVESPPAGAAVRDASVDLIVRVGGATLTAIGIETGYAGGELRPMGGGLVAIPVRLPTEGRHDIGIMATDAAGVQTEIRHALVLDTTPPELQLDEPTGPIARVSEARVVFRGRVTDAGSGPAKVGAVLGARAPRVAVVDDAGRFELPVPLEDATSEVRIIAVDRAGNETEAVVTVVQDATGPEMTFLGEGFPAEVWGRGRSLTVTGELDEDGTVTLGDASVPVDDKRRFVIETELELGVNEVAVTARDPAGNERRATFLVVAHRQKPRHPLVPDETWWTPTRAQLEHAFAERLPVWVENELGMRFVLIPPGTFTMGSPAIEADRKPDERAHEVTITEGFYLGAHEVTNAQLRRFDPKHEMPRWEAPQGRNRPRDGERQPAGALSWKKAAAFCRWLDGTVGGRHRLPTEAEWELACRGGTTTAAFWGETPDAAHRYANVLDKVTARLAGKSGSEHPGDDGQRVGAEVGSFRPNPFGLYDIIGNHLEWCHDWYAPYPDGPATDPTGPKRRPETDPRRVSRGGAWLTGRGGARCARRQPVAPNGVVTSGLRVALRAER